MKFEVEQKFPVTDLRAVEQKLKALGAVISGTQLEADVYYRHPARDFSQTDEALRIRTVGLSGYITYKGPKVDTTTKTRREIELPLTLDDEGIGPWRRLIEALSFTPVAEVRKHRRKATVRWNSRKVNVSLDEVQDLGEFVELELVAVADHVEREKAVIRSLAEELGLFSSERRSYLELVMAAKG